MRFSANYEDTLISDYDYARYLGREVIPGVILTGRNERNKMAHYTASIIRYLELKKKNPNRIIVKGWV